MSSPQVTWDEPSQSQVQWDDEKPPSAASPIAPPPLATAPGGGRGSTYYSTETRPQNMQQVDLLTGQPYTPLPQQLKEMAAGFSRNLLQMWAPGMAVSVINQRFPNAPIPQAVKDLATPIKQLPGQIVQNMAPIIVGGMDEPAPNVQPATRPQVASSPQAPAPGPSIGSIMARHIPVVGKVLRTIDDVQALLGKDSPHPTAINNIAPGKAPIPETNGIQWGTGGQGPLDLRGKMIPGTQPDYQVQQIPLPNITPTKASTVDPYREQILPPMTKGVSGNVEAHAYDPNTNTMITHFKSGDIYKYEGVPQQVYNQFKNAESQGSFHYNNIRGRYETTKIGKVAATRASRVSSALQRGSQ